MASSVVLVGLDFGSTTTSAIFADATLERGPGGRIELGALIERYRSDIVFTPLSGQTIDLEAASSLIDRWFSLANVRPGEPFAGGAIITGLCARRANAAELSQIIRARVGDAVLAVADDPRLEAFLAFMGSAAPASRERPDVPILNLDVGGGTTNLALGLAGEVLGTGCLFVGARHIALDPETRRITSLTREARAALAALGLTREEGERLSEEDAEKLAALYVAWLEAVVFEDADVPHPEAFSLHVTHPLHRPSGMTLAPPLLTFSGGVGELVYSARAGTPLPSPGFFGDLGVDLTRKILDSPRLAPRLLVPRSMGRATAYGLLSHGTQIAGSTVFLPHPEILPLEDIPLLGRLSPSSSDEDIARALDLAKTCRGGAGLEIVLPDASSATVREMGKRLAAGLENARPAIPIVFVTSRNAGKTLGHYATGWGRSPANVVVIDEVDPSGALFLRIGRARGDLLPISFHGKQT